MEVDIEGPVATHDDRLEEPVAEVSENTIVREVGGFVSTRSRDAIQEVNNQGGISMLESDSVIAGLLRDNVNLTCIEEEDPILQAYDVTMGGVEEEKEQTMTSIEDESLEIAPEGDWDPCVSSAVNSSPGSSAVLLMQLESERVSSCKSDNAGLIDMSGVGSPESMEVDIEGPVATHDDRLEEPVAEVSENTIVREVGEFVSTRSGDAIRQQNVLRQRLYSGWTYGDMQEVETFSFEIKSETKSSTFDEIDTVKPMVKSSKKYDGWIYLDVEVSKSTTRIFLFSHLILIFNQCVGTSN